MLPRTSGSCTLYDEAFTAADESDRKLALALLEQYIQARR